MPIVDTPIYLTIYRKNQFDLTLIDLPGMTYFDASIKDKNGLKINKMIKQMWRHYISNENAVILITIQATSDYATTQAIQIAAEDDIDPEGLRTFTVITKVDMRPTNEPF